TSPPPTTIARIYRRIVADTCRASVRRLVRRDVADDGVAGLLVHLLDRAPRVARRRLRPLPLEPLATAAAGPTSGRVDRILVAVPAVRHDGRAADPAARKRCAGSRIIERVQVLFRLAPAGEPQRGSIVIAR